MSDIFELIDAGDAEGVRELLAREPQAAAVRDAQGLSALMRASYRSPELVEAVGAAAPPLDGFDAILVGDLDRMAAPDQWSPDGFSPLHLAVFARRPEAVRVLLERGADPNVLARHAQIRVRPLHTAAAFGGDAKIARILLEHGADPNAGTEERGFTALHSAAQGGNAELVRLLLAHGADRQVRTDDGRLAADLTTDDEVGALLS